MIDDHNNALYVTQGPCTNEHHSVNCREHWFTCRFHDSHIEGVHRHTLTESLALERSYEDARAHLKGSI